MKKTFLLKTMLLLYALIVGSSSVWADVESEKTYSTTSTSNLPEGWSGEGSGSSYIQLTNSSCYIQTSSFAQNGFSSIVVKARKYGGPSAAQAVITVSWYSDNTETVLGTISPTSTSLSNYTISSPNNPTGNTTGYIKIQCKGASSGKGCGVSEVTITYTAASGGDTPTLDDCDLALTGSTVLSFDLYNNSSAQVINYTTSSTGAVTIADNDYATFDIDETNKTITVTPTAVTPSAQTITVNQAADDNYKAGSATFTFTITDSTPKTGAWVLTDLADLTEGDVFVIVGDNGDTYAMSNNNGTSSAPSAVAVTIENNEITSDVDDNIKWTISGNAENGYTFYPNGDTNSWLYCNTTASSSSNNNMRVGTGDRKVFDFTGYLVTKDNYTARYLSIYNDTDWRGYVNTNSAPSISFYKYSAAVTVKNPVITVDETFTGSTTATITCATQDATIYYSFDNTNWTEYTEALTITETTTIYAKAVKDEDESAVVSKTTTRVLPKPTVTIDATGITNTNVFEGTMAGSLAASVTYNDAAVEGAVVTWSENNSSVATIDKNTGAVTLVAAGTVTFTATYAGNSDYSGNTETYEMTVTNDDPNAPGTENNPYKVSEITATENGVYVQGIISSITEVSTQYKNATYKISEDGTTTNEFTVFRGRYLDNADFTSEDQISVGDSVVIYGNIGIYQEQLQLAQNNYLVKLIRKVATPTFDPESGEVMAGSKVTISTATKDATIYYTTNGDEPTTESVEYAEPITINADMTIKAIAVKDGMTNSNVASASYTINLTPSITVAENSIDAPAEGKDGTITVTYNNITEVESDVYFCDAEGNAATYEWVYAEINGENNIEYIINANASTEPRTAYFKVYAMDDETNLVYSDLVTVTQAGVVIDYATLPFDYNGEKANLPTGMTQSGLGSDYNSNTSPNTQLKFDSSDDYVILKINEAATELSFDIKGNGFSGGTFTVQASTDGVEYTDLEVYTDISESQEKLLLNENVRYIKWVYTEKQSGNVGLGNIKVQKRLGNATVSLASDCNDGEGMYYGTYSNAAGFIVPEDLIVAEVGIDGDNKLIVTEYTAGDIVPANTGVMVSSETAGAHNVVLSTGATYLAGENRLRATGNEGISADDMDTADANCKFYRLTMHNGTDLGFYWGAAEGAAFAVAANKAYLAVPAVIAARIQGFSFTDGVITGISQIENEQSINENVFDLQGRRIAKPAKGLYIMNGKKVVVK